jgi:Ubiquitin-activating enzyme E1 FCCH domain/Baseplate J-like protein
MADLPIVMNSFGYVPQTPTFFNDLLISTVSASVPGYTANLPGSLIEDMSSTVVFAELQLDSSLTEIIASISPYAANPWLLSQLGNVYGVGLQQPSATTVFVVFSGSVGFFVPSGFLITDGLYQYVISTGSSIAAGGQTIPLLATATISGSWPIPPNTVNALVTSVPSGITLTVNNPSEGIPGNPAVESQTAYRSRVLQAGLSASQGMTRYLKTLVSQVPNVQPRLVSTRLLQINSINYWEIIVGGGDPYAVASAIFSSLFDLTSITGSIIEISGVTNANPSVYTTNINHGYVTGQLVTFSGMTGGSWGLLNSGTYTATVHTATTFSISLDTTSYGSYTGGGSVTPNFRNVVVDILDYPDTYGIPIVVPPQQNVTITCTWNTFSSNYINPDTIANLVVPAVVAYINSIYVGQPINIFVLNTTFQAAVINLVPAQLITRLVWTISINGTGASPIGDTGEIPGDPESFFYTTSASITVTQG